jgi:transposase-like protein
MMKERRHFSDEPKAEAVKMVARDGLTHSEVARRLGVPKGSIGN